MSRPWNLLPLAPPAEKEYTEKYFYENFAKPLTEDFIRIMNNGIHVDPEAVEELRNTLDDVLSSVRETIDTSPVIQAFQEYMYPIKWQEYLDEMKTKKRPIDKFIKPYKEDNVVHRTYLVNYILHLTDNDEYIKDKWIVKDLKITNSILQLPDLDKVINKLQTGYEDAAMLQLATDKMTIYNKSHYDDKVASKPKDDILPPFNPGSSPQLIQLFEFLDIEPLAETKTGNPSWGRDQIEEVFNTLEDSDLKTLLQAFIDFSFSSIVRSNFIEAFDKFVIDGKLHGNIKLFGAKSFRPTSNKPNMLNFPSTKSIYSKPLKKCFIAPEGFITAAIDLSALEDRVIANLSRDPNKLAVFTEGLDGHSLAATYYFKEEIEELIGPYTDHKQAAKDLKTLVDNNDKKAKSIRQRSKPISFGLAYGAFPPKVSKSVKCSLQEAETIFNRYHNELFKEITKYREETVYAKAVEQGYVHLGLGCRLYTDDVGDDIRTLANGTVQFWSIISLIAVNELHHRITEAGYDDDIQITSTIYDAIYFNVRKDPKIISWLNKNAVECINVDYMENIIVHNESELDVGPNWADVVTLTNDASLEGIENILKEM